MSSRSSSMTSASVYSQDSDASHRLTLVEQELLSLAAVINAQDARTDADIRKAARRLGLIHRMRHAIESETYDEVEEYDDEDVRDSRFVEDEDDVEFNSPLLGTSHMLFRTPPTLRVMSKVSTLRESFAARVKEVKPLQILKRGDSGSKKTQGSEKGPEKAREGGAGRAGGSTSSSRAPLVEEKKTTTATPTPISDRFVSKSKPLPSPTATAKPEPASGGRARSRSGSMRSVKSLAEKMSPPKKPPMTPDGKMKPLPPLPIAVPVPSPGQVDDPADDRTPRPGDRLPWGPTATPTTPSTSTPTAPREAPRTELRIHQAPQKLKPSQFLLNLASRRAYVAERARRVLSVVAEDIDDYEFVSAPQGYPHHHHQKNSSTSSSNTAFSSSSSSSTSSFSPASSSSSFNNPNHSFRGHNRSGSSSSQSSSGGSSYRSYTSTLVDYQGDTNTTLKQAKEMRDRAAMKRAKTLVASRSSVAVPRPDWREREGYMENRDRVRIVPE